LEKRVDRGYLSIHSSRALSLKANLELNRIWNYGWSGTCTAGNRPHRRSYRSGPTHQQTANEKLQPFSVVVLKFEKLYTQGISSHTPHYRRIDPNRQNIIGEVEPDAAEITRSKRRVEHRGATRQRKIANASFGIDIFASHGYGQIDGQSFIFPTVFLDALVADPPLQESKAVTAKLATEGIHIKSAQESLHLALTADSLNELTGAFWTN
jgi:hypothetical protein